MFCWFPPIRDVTRLGWKQAIQSIQCSKNLESVCLLHIPSQCNEAKHMYIQRFGSKSWLRHCAWPDRWMSQRDATSIECHADPIWNTEKLDFVRARANCYSKCRQWKMCKLSMKNLFRALRTQYWSYEPLNKIWPRCLFSLANYRYCMVFEHNFTIFIEQWTCVPCKDNIVV